MGIPLTIKPEDNEKLLFLKKRTGAKSKVEVLRTALNLYDLQVAKKERIKKWQKAASLIGDTSLEVLSDFKTKNRFEDLD